MNAKWTSERRFVPVHLTSGNHATSFSSTQQSQSTKSSFASEDVVKSVVPVGADPPPTASLRFPRNNAADTTESVTADLSLVQADTKTSGYPVIVFGAPADHQQQIIDHFKQFGDLEVSANQNIECGRNYVRLTYSSEPAAQRALLENGKLGPGGFMLGCVGDLSRPESSGAATRDATPDPIKISVKPASDSLFKTEDKGESLVLRILNGVSTAIFGISDL